MDAFRRWDEMVQTKETRVLSQFVSRTRQAALWVARAHSRCRDTQLWFLLLESQTIRPAARQSEVGVSPWTSFISFGTKGRTMYMVSRDGLYSIDPKGAVTKVFKGVDWMDK